MEEEKYQLIVARNYTEEQMREIWHNEYVCQNIVTHDGITVKFYDDNFDHAFYESSRRNVSKNDIHYKDSLSMQRLSRIHWIKDVLMDPTAIMKLGYDNKKGRYDYAKRVSIVKGNYMVIIQLYGDRTRAKFVTAFVATAETKAKVMSDADWVG